MLKSMINPKLILGFMLIMLLALNVSSLFAFAGGDGSAEHPYQVSNATELNDVRNFLSSYFIQNADIDLDVAPYNTGSGWEPIGNSSTKFTGTFDGNGYKITNLFINQTYTNYIGLFGYTAGGSEIKNVSLEGIDVTGFQMVGGLVGYLWGGAITNSYATGSVSSSSIHIGGLVGYNSWGTITNSYSTDSVSGTNYIGGLVGLNDHGTLTNSYSTGSVSGATQVGGLVGWNYGGTITNSYSTGSVTGTSNVGGLVGCNPSSTVSKSFYNSETSGQSDNTEKGVPKTTAEMTTDALIYNYTSNIYLNGGWDFKGESENGTDDIWNIGNSRNNGYPYLNWQYPEDPATLPVELSTFTVQYLNNTPTLYWTTQSETDNLGWNVYRNVEEDFSSAQKITNGLIPGSGTTTEPSYYNFNDNDETLEIGTTYWYWLESIDLGGETHYSNSRSITIPTPGEEPYNNEPPVVYILNTAPNPMNSSTYFNFTLDKSVEATISIYNIKGELVRTLPKVWADAEAEATVYWNGKDENGNRLQAGVYLYKLLVNGKTYKTNKLILMR